MILIDLSFDFTIAKTKYKTNIFAKKGFYYDAELAELIHTN